MWRFETGRLLGTMILAIAFAGALAHRSQAQGGGGQVAARTTASGVYTAAQATRGESTYMSVCVGCHPPTTYKGPVFFVVWGGRPLSDLFEAVSMKMPKNDPGTLEPVEYADLVAYLLKINGLPAGRLALPPDAGAMRSIRIEAPAARKGGAGGN